MKSAHEIELWCGFPNHITTAQGNANINIHVLTNQQDLTKVILVRVATSGFGFRRVILHIGKNEIKMLSIIVVDRFMKCPIKWILAILK